MLTTVRTRVKRLYAGSKAVYQHLNMVPFGSQKMNPSRRGKGDVDGEWWE